MFLLTIYVLLDVSNAPVDLGGLRQGFGSREQRVKMDGREQGALKIPLGAGSRASRQKEQGVTELLSKNIEKPIN